MEPAKDNKTSSVLNFKLREQFLNAMKDVKNVFCSVDGSVSSG